MIILEHTPSESDILDLINDGIRQLNEAGSEAKYVVLGTAAYSTFRNAMATRFNRTAKYFETYNFLPIVVDPFRTDAVCVLPGPGEIAKGVQVFRIDS